MPRTSQVLCCVAPCNAVRSPMTLVPFLKSASSVSRSQVGTGITDGTASSAVVHVRSHYEVVLTARMAVPWLRRLATGFVPRKAGFSPMSVHAGSAVDQVALG